MKDHFEMMAAYNRWANQRLYEAAATLDDAQYHENRGAFFGSMENTLNHILVADRVWLNRFTGEGPKPRSLDEIISRDRDELARLRSAEDQRIIDYIADISEEELGDLFSYTPISTPERITQRLNSALAHFFNHQTHHRGHCHMILTSFGKPSVVLDLAYFLRAPEGGKWL